MYELNIYFENHDSKDVPPPPPTPRKGHIGNWIRDTHDITKLQCEYGDYSSL